MTCWVHAGTVVWDSKALWANKWVIGSTTLTVRSTTRTLFTSSFTKLTWGWSVCCHKISSVSAIQAFSWVRRTAFYASSEAKGAICCAYNLHRTGFAAFWITFSRTSTWTSFAELGTGLALTCCCVGKIPWCVSSFALQSIAGILGWTSSSIHIITFDTWSTFESKTGVASCANWSWRTSTPLAIGMTLANSASYNWITFFSLCADWRLKADTAGNTYFASNLTFFN